MKPRSGVDEIVRETRAELLADPAELLADPLSWRCPCGVLNGRDRNGCRACARAWASSPAPRLPTW